VVGLLPKCAEFIDNTNANKTLVDEEEPECRQGKEQLNADQGEIIGSRGVATEMYMHAVTLAHHGDANYGHDRAGIFLD